MTIRNFEGHTPKIGQRTYIDSTAVVIGDVEIGEDSSIWPTAVLRGDINAIRIGHRTSIQDGSVIHVTHAGPFSPSGFITTVGHDVTVGHRVILHGCTIDNFCLIGMGSIIMDGAMIEPHTIIGAGSLVSPKKIIEGGYLWLGSPIKKIRPLTREELDHIAYSSQYYARLKDRHASVA